METKNFNIVCPECGSYTPIVCSERAREGPLSIKLMFDKVQKLTIDRIDIKCDYCKYVGNFYPIGYYDRINTSNTK